jgi:hypothetical protein
MKKVEIYKLEEDGSQTTIATCKLQPDSVVVCEGDKDLVAHLENNGITDYLTNFHRTVFPRDGEIFLINLERNFSSGYINASDVIEE